MGKVTTDITLLNAGDETNAERGIIKEPEIRSVKVKATVDTGAGTLIINEDVRRQLGLNLRGEPRKVLMADGRVLTFQETEPVTICWKNRSSTLKAVLLPDAKEILLGALPLEDMDLIINPGLQEVTAAHGDVIEVLAL